MNQIIKSIKTTLLIVLILFNAAVVSAQEEKKTLSFIVGTHASSNITADVYFKFLEMAYAEIGYTLTLKMTPMQRAYKGVDNGSSDGMVIVPEHIVKIYENIVIVPVLFTTIDIMAITNGLKFKPDGADGLKSYKVGIIRGYRLTEKLTRDLDRQVVNNHHSLLSILEIGRVDVALAMKRETLRFLKKNPQYKNITILEPPFVSIKLYSALNKKHAAIGDQVAPVMERLLAQGELEKLYEPYKIKSQDSNSREK